jgi:ATP-binding cassette subfamily F protein 3
MPRRNERDIQKEVRARERNIAALDEQKRESNAKLLQCSDPPEALRLHNEATALTTQLADLETR